MRRIAENHADRIALEQPFAVPPKDGATKALIFNNHADNIVFKNHFENGGAFQFYGLQLHTVIAENTFKKVFSMDPTRTSNAAEEESPEPFSTSDVVQASSPPTAKPR